MAVRGTQRISVTVDPADAVVTFSSADPSIASVDSTGLITGMAHGSTIITVSAGDKSAQIPVDVQIDI
jgi:uncharacterized protein YjdB